MILDRVRHRMIDPKYLNTREAIFDFERLIFVVYKEKLLHGKTDEEITNIKRELLHLCLYLRSLSNSSGLVKERKSGYTAFSHWMEAVYIYLENDSHPTIRGIKEL